MAQFRDNLPQLSGKPFLTEGGLETTLIFHHGVDLPEFALFVVLDNEKDRETLKQVFRDYAKVAVDRKMGMVFETVTWRANPDWGAKVGYDKDALADIDRRAIEFLEEIRNEFQNDDSPVVISAQLGPRGDGYSPEKVMTAEEARAYHAPQINTLAETNADLITMLTGNYIEEPTGIALAAKDAGMPVVISFTVETDGRLPSGDTLQEAIEAVDAATDNYPAYYMINCAHPTHFESVLEPGAPWMNRIRGLRANASCMSHQELDEAEELDAGNPTELGQEHKALLKQFPQINVLGGCCGTDDSHIAAIVDACWSKG